MEAVLDKRYCVQNTKTMINSVADSDAVKITESGGSHGPAKYSWLYPYIL
jgi:hypothetical protein